MCEKYSRDLPPCRLADYGTQSVYIVRLCSAREYTRTTQVAGRIRHCEGCKSSCWQTRSVSRRCRWTPPPPSCAASHSPTPSSMPRPRRPSIGWLRRTRRSGEPRAAVPRRRRRRRALGARLRREQKRERCAPGEASGRARAGLLPGSKCKPERWSESWPGRVVGVRSLSGGGWWRSTSRWGPCGRQASPCASACPRASSMLGFLYSYLIMLAELYAIGELKRKARAPCHSRQPFLSVAHIHPDAPPRAGLALQPRRPSRVFPTRDHLLHPR